MRSEANAKNKKYKSRNHRARETNAKNEKWTTRNLRIRGIAGIIFLVPLFLSPPLSFCLYFFRAFLLSLSLSLYLSLSFFPPSFFLLIAFSFRGHRPPITFLWHSVDKMDQFAYSCIRQMQDKHWRLMQINHQERKHTRNYNNPQ